MNKQTELLDELDANSNLKDIQVYMDEIVKLRGFDDESAKDIMLLMTEEIGELAKAIRKHSGIKIDVNKKDKYNPISEEIADVFIYLVDLCNVLEIDLFTAFRDKKIINSNRFFDKQ